MPPPPPAAARPNGAANGAAYGAPPNAAPNAAALIDAATVIARLEDAGRSLLALPERGHSPRLRTSAHDIVRAAEAMGAASAAPGRLRPPPPDAAAITRMDEALGWLARLPADRVVLRRIVGSRALVCPLTDRHLVPWRRLAALVGADHKAVQRWHAQAIDLIVASLNGTRLNGTRLNAAAPPQRCASVTSVPPWASAA